MDEHVRPCLGDEQLADVMRSQGDQFYQEAKVAAEATGAAAVQPDGQPEPDSVMVSTFSSMLQITSLSVKSNVATCCMFWFEKEPC